MTSEEVGGQIMPNEKAPNTTELKPDETVPPSEKLKALNALFGTWAGQPDLDQVFKEIEEERKLGARKDVSFED